ncbi:MAG: serine hydrolase domain-containing protein [Pseudomonadota bacterium]
MHRFYAIIVSAFLLMVSPACSVSAQPVLADDVTAQIEAYLDEVTTDYGIAGQSLAILRNGTLVHTSARGLSSVELGVPASEETVYQGFSLAKLFVNVAIMQLVEAGSIKLDAPISFYLEKLPETWQTLTIRQALSHMTGLPDYYQWPRPTPETPQDALQSVINKPLEFETGSATRYNQTNYLLLKMIIERTTGEQFAQAMTERMIEELELEHSSYGGEYAVIAGRATTYRSANDVLARNVRIDQPDYMFASTGLNTTVLDMAEWFSALMDHRFLSDRSIQAMWTPVFLNDGSVANFANGWEFAEEDGLRIVGHGGGNRTDVRHFFEPGAADSVTVIYFTNGSAKNFWPGNVSSEIARIIRSN